MAARLGLLLYWVGCAGGALVVVLGAYVFATLPDHRPDVLAFFVVAAGLIFAAGWGLRFVLAGR